MVKDETQQEAIARIYIVERHKDPHTVFAAWAHLDRDKAKTEAYRSLYAVPFVRGMLNANPPPRR